jgi:hypothetical protein
MKKTITLLFILIITSCASKEEKIQKIIEGDLFKTLYDFKSYEPIETKIDSAYLENYMIPEVMPLAFECSKHFDRFSEYIDEARKEQKTMEIWRSSRSSFGYENYMEAYNKMGLAVDKFQTERVKINELYSEIRKLTGKHNFDKPEFIGWKAVHRFRAKTKGGHANIGTYLYIIDKEFKEIIYNEDIEDEEIIKAKAQIIHALEEEKEIDNDTKQVSVLSEKMQSIIKTAMPKRVKEYEPVSFGEPEEIENGWEILHTYKGLSKSGEKRVYLYVFHLDKNVTRVIKVSKY